MVAQSCPTLRPRGRWSARLLCPGSLRARVLGRVAIPHSRGSSRPGDWAQVSRMLYCLSHLGSPWVVAICPEKNWRKKDFPGGPVVKTPAFQCRGRGFDPRSGSQESIYHAAQEKGKTNMERQWILLQKGENTNERDSADCTLKLRSRVNKQASIAVLMSFKIVTT